MKYFLNRYQTSLPYLIACFLATLFFTIGSIYPYEIGADVGAQIKTIQQWLSGESNLFYSIVIANPQDLSQDLQNWLFWWPPGVAIVFFPLIALGVPLGIALKITAYLLFILGCIGWLKVTDKLQVNLAVKLIFSVVLPIYSLGYATTYLAAALGGGDILSFGIMPWVFIYTLYITDDLTAKSNIQYKEILLNFTGIGFLLGSFYWIKYSAFVGCLGILLYLAIWSIFIWKQFALKRRIVLLGFLAISCFIPIIFLTIINRNFAGMTTATTQITSAINSGNITTQGIGNFLSLLGSQGLSLFQSVDLLIHLIFFLPAKFNLMSDISSAQKQLLLVIAGIPGSLLVSWFIWYSRNIYPKKIFILICCVSYTPFIVLAILSNKLNHNFLAGDVSRLTVGFFILTQIVLINAYLDWLLKLRKVKYKIISYCLIAIFFISPNFFVVGNFIKNYVWERRGIEYITTQNRLYTPSLSETNVKSVVNQINMIAKKQKDVVVLATEYGSTYQTWLEIKQRILPIFDWWAVTTHIRDTEKFTTSQDLRVVLVIPKNIEKERKRFLELQQRFPQAKIWYPVENTGKTEATVSLWFSDLKVE
jgi:hypothetical protein